MNKVLLFVHGRSNKPRPAVLRQWWLNSINDGQLFIKKPVIDEKAVTVDMAYYANVFYKQPLLVKDIKEPYKKPLANQLKHYDDSVIDVLKDMGGELVGLGVEYAQSLGILSSVAEQLTKEFLEDLDSYYNDESNRLKIQQRLINKIVQHQNREIILVAHSMGAIIAYDVLKRMGSDNRYNDITVEHFITLGSSLGFAPVKAKFNDEYSDQLRVPDLIFGSWNNYIDNGDILTLGSRLADEFAPNIFDVKAIDQAVVNDYPNNSHKSYGYLRTPEFSRHLSGLL